MPTFVLDACMDVVEGQKGYIASFFRDVFRLNGWEVVVGGSLMMSQMARKEGLLQVVNQLRASNRLRTVERARVDEEEERIRGRASLRLGAIPVQCDDIHIIALCLIDGCGNVITKDHRLGDCVNILRRELGHAFCPSIRIISNEETYLRLKRSNLL